jgi:hypothetical protein
VKHLLNGRGGDALTTCNLLAARYDELTADLAEHNCRDCRAALIRQGVCPECGGDRVSWSYGPVKLLPIPDGRLTMRDVETQFHLGCEECSATLIHSVGPEVIAAFLNAGSAITLAQAVMAS